MNIIKKTALFLASVTTLSVLASCGAQKTDSSITASAGTDKYVSLLEDRLDTMPHSLVIATEEDAEKYGIDTDSFVYDDGYTIRASDGNVVIVGKTTDGIDRAVRHYASYGNDESYSYTYGETYRVSSLTINGIDISEYAIVRPDDADECMLYAADELAKYIKLACGAELPEYSATAYAEAESRPMYKIELTVDYPGHGDEAFSINVNDNGNIDILCGRYRGGLYGVYGLLYNVGWRFLGDDIQHLYEAENVNLTNEINRTEDAAIPYRTITEYTVYDYAVGSRLNLHGRYVNEAAKSKYGYYGIIYEADHGLQVNYDKIDWAGKYSGIKVENRQPCFTDEDILQNIEDFYRNLIVTNLANGLTPDNEFKYIDVAQFDHGTFCKCENCQTVLKEEKSNAGAVLRMTNRMADMAAEYDERISVLMLAYNGTSKAPALEKPRDNVKIAYCFYLGAGDAFAACSNHTLAGGECTDSGYNNNEFYKEFEEWKTICKSDNLQVWYYPLNMYEVGFQLPTFDTLYYDMQYIINSNVSTIILCSRHNNDTILMSLAAKLLWDKSITEEEYLEMVKEYFNIVYGEAGKIMYEYTMMLTEAGDLEGCWCAFHSSVADMVDDRYIKMNFDYMTELLDRALEIAETEKIANLIETVKAKLFYLGISLLHEERYANGTDEQRIKISEQYRWMHEMFLKHNIPVFDDYTTQVYVPSEIDLERSPSDHWYNSIGEREKNSK